MRCVLHFFATLSLCSPSATTALSFPPPCFPPTSLAHVLHACTFMIFTWIFVHFHLLCAHISVCQGRACFFRLRTRASSLIACISCAFVASYRKRNVFHHWQQVCSVYLHTHPCYVITATDKGVSTLPPSARTCDAYSKHAYMCVSTLTLKYSLAASLLQR